MQSLFTYDRVLSMLSELKVYIPLLDHLKRKLVIIPAWPSKMGWTPSCFYAKS